MTSQNSAPGNPGDMRLLARLVLIEGRNLAERQQRGELTWEKVEELYVESGDGEALIALAYLDAWKRPMR